MIGRDFLTRMRVGLKPVSSISPAWLGGSASPRFVLRATWTSPSAPQSRERWKASFSCGRRTLVVDNSRRPQLRLVKAAS